MKILFLCSANGGNFKFMHILLTKGILQNVQFNLIADRDCGAVKYAQEHNIPSSVINYSRNSSNVELLSLLEKINPDIIVTNWNKILDEDIVLKYEQKLVNLHYSLLPAFKGLIGMKTLVEAYKQNCQFVGATSHSVAKEVDAGRIIGQYVMKISGDINRDTDCLFRNACLLLLNTFVIQHNLELHLPISADGDENFSPKLKFDLNNFDDSFWREVKQA